VKSEPPGPAFFRFQGVPRDPVLRPKLDPPFFSLFLTHFSPFFCFMICAFCHFCCFYKCDKLINLVKVAFFNHDPCNVIRPYGKCDAMTLIKYSGS